jgi:hypothetical protein
MAQGKFSVLFSFHAAQRIKQRLNTNVSTRNDVDISQAFFKAKVYRSNDTGRMVEAWASRDTVNRVVLVVDQQSRVVQTVYTGGALNDRPAPFVDSCYA